MSRTEGGGNAVESEARIGFGAWVSPKRRSSSSSIVTTPRAADYNSFPRQTSPRLPLIQAPPALLYLSSRLYRLCPRLNPHLPISAYLAPQSTMDRLSRMLAAAQNMGGMGGGPAQVRTIAQARLSSSHKKTVYSLREQMTMFAARHCGDAPPLAKAHFLLGYIANPTSH